MTDQDSSALIERLQGKYPIGPHLPNGKPEFGFRQFEAPPIQHEAAAALTAAHSRIEAQGQNIDHMLKAMSELRKQRDATWNEANEAAARAQEAALRKGVNPEKHSDHIRALKKGEPHDQDT